MKESLVLVALVSFAAGAIRLIDRGNSDFYSDYDLVCSLHQGDTPARCQGGRSYALVVATILPQDSGQNPKGAAYHTPACLPPLLSLPSFDLSDTTAIQRTMRTDQRIAVICVLDPTTASRAHMIYTHYRPSTSLYAFPNVMRRRSWYIFNRDPTIRARYCTPHCSNMTEKITFTTTPAKRVVRAEYGSIISSSRIMANFGGDNKTTVLMRPRMTSENMSQPDGKIVMGYLMKPATIEVRLTICPHRFPKRWPDAEHGRGQHVLEGRDQK